MKEIRFFLNKPIEIKNWPEALMLGIKNHPWFFVSFFVPLLLITSYLLLATRLAPEVPLFYSRFWGEGQLIRKEGLLLLPLTGIAIGFIHLIIVKRLGLFGFYKNLLEITAGLLNLLLAMAFGRILIIALR